MIDLSSDNNTGASEAVLDGIVRANDGAMPAYGADPLTVAVTARLSEVFEREVAVILVATGTAANALALSALLDPWGLCVCHAEAHVIDDECGAPEFFSGGAKLLGLPGIGGKVAPEALAAGLASLPAAEKQMPAQAVSLSQATEAGLVHAPAEVAAVAEVCRSNGLSLHMDGARFANALVATGASPADMTWRAGVDVLSLGGTKNGCLAAEAVVVFDPALARTLGRRRKRSGHTLSKGRFLAAQFLAYLSDDHWLDNARRANAAAARLSAGLVRRGARLAWPTEANEVFAILPAALDERLRAGGARYHPWASAHLGTAPPGADERLVRMVTSFRTGEDEIERLLALADAEDDGEVTRS